MSYCRNSARMDLVFSNTDLFQLIQLARYRWPRLLADYRLPTAALVLQWKFLIRSLLTYPEVCRGAGAQKCDCKRDWL